MLLLQTTTFDVPSDSVMAPTNGMVSYSSPVEGGSYVFGTVATFSCSPGFGLSTLETRTCTGPQMMLKLEPSVAQVQHVMVSSRIIYAYRD